MHSCYIRILQSSVTNDGDAASLIRKGKEVHHIALFIFRGEVRFLALPQAVYPYKKSSPLLESYLRIPISAILA
jgi:hypothetical protein